MSDPIKPGDLVVVTQWPCCAKYLGRIGPVLQESGVFTSGDCYSACCNKQGVGAGMAYLTMDSGPGGPLYAPLSWVKRIPDFPELKDERHDEEISA